MIRTDIPARASSRDIVNPVGPAPTMSASIFIPRPHRAMSKVKSPKISVTNSDHLKVAHHRHVLVLQIVAVKNISASIAFKLHKDARCLAGEHANRVLPSSFGYSATPPVA